MRAIPARQCRRAMPTSNGAYWRIVPVDTNLAENPMITESRSNACLSGAASNELVALAERVRAGVVEVSDGRGTGAGTIWSADGLIITNHHVVPGETARVTLADETVHEARVIASLPERDLS